MIKVRVTFINNKDEKETAEGQLISMDIDSASGFRIFLILLPDNRIVYGDGYDALSFQEFSSYVSPRMDVAKQYLSNQNDIQIIE